MPGYGDELTCFNPLPSPKQGETGSPVYRCPTRQCFNPLPSPKQGETALPKAIEVLVLASFNPLPSPKQGETHEKDGSASPKHLARVSIRSPHRSKGRQLAVVQGFVRCDLLVTEVSIRSPHRSKGRPAPPERYERCAAAVSIRSPHRSKGRLQALDPFASLDRVSIRSPHRSKGRPSLSPISAMAAYHRFVSIRSPHRSKGRLSLPSNVLFSFVSIRSPHRSKGRRQTEIEIRKLELFQSAPLTEARGDVKQSGRTRPHVIVSIRSPHRSKGRRPAPTATTPASCFNPLPSPKQGETIVNRVFDEREASFNPLPSPKQGETQQLS